MSYWIQRQKQLNNQLEKDEIALKKRLSSFYDSEYRKLEKEIAAYYAMYGEDKVIEYRTLMQNLPDEDKRRLIERMQDFIQLYPDYADLLPVRESIYKLNRLEGLQYSVRMQQLEIGAVNNEQITDHLRRQAMRSVNAAAEIMGFGKNFYANNPEITKRFVGVAWSDGKNFSQRIWENTNKLANYLNTDIAQGLARGDSYDKLVRQLRERFGRVSRNDAYRLIYTEGTYVMAESSMQPFTEDFEEYRISTVGDERVCDVCRALADQTFRIEDRQPGVNFPPLHPWCRCTFEIVVRDWNAWMDEYEKKHNNGQVERVVEQLGINRGGMKLSLPDEVYKKSGMTEKTRQKIDTALKKLDGEFVIYIDKVEGEYIKDSHAIFTTGGFIDDDDVLKHVIVFNYNVDYEKVERNMLVLYNKGRMAGKSFEDYIAHEVAHILPFQNCTTAEEYKNARAELRKQFVPGISGYADITEDGAESLAEAFVRYRNGEDIPEEARRLIQKYIEPWRR